MAPPDSSDQSLLNRLNALKPTTISLKQNPTLRGLAHSSSTSTDENNLTGSSPVEKRDQPPLSREDALAERLRILRNSSQPETPKLSSTNSLSASASGGLSTSSSGICGPAQPHCSATQLGGDMQTSSWQNISSSSTTTEKAQRSINDSGNPLSNKNEGDDYLQYLESGGDPDQTLDELLDGLDEEFSLDGDDDNSPLSEFDPAKEARKVSKLLEQFQKEKDNNTSGSGVSFTADQQRNGHAVTVPGRVSRKAPPQRAPPAAGNGDRDDDSENEEQMTRDVEQILSRVRDELGVASEDKKEGDNNGEAGESEISTPAFDLETNDRTPPTPNQEPSKGNVNDDSNPTDTAPSLALPDAPAAPLREINTTEGEGEGRKSSDFENDIVTRLASLKGLGKGINTDAFGLPVAPTFSPQEHPKKDTDSKKFKSSGGYTDEDQKTWCIVCLDEATIKCIGCDSDVYCGRCWRDMHVGPSAGYDERGHQWVKFVRSHP